MAQHPPPGTPPRRRRIRRWIAAALIVVVSVLVVSQALDPYDERGYMHVPHGDHTHYVPRDRDPTVPINRFPVIYPGPDERIMPDGRVVRVAPQPP